MVGFKEATALRNKLLAWHAEVIISDITGSEVGFKTCNLHWRQAQLLLHTRTTTTSLLKHTATQCLALNRHEETFYIEQSDDACGCNQRDLTSDQLLRHILQGPISVNGLFIDHFWVWITQQDCLLPHFHMQQAGHYWLVKLYAIRHFLIIAKKYTQAILMMTKHTVTLTWLLLMLC